MGKLIFFYLLYKKIMATLNMFEWDAVNILFDGFIWMCRLNFCRKIENHGFQYFFNMLDILI